MENDEELSVQSPHSAIRNAVGRMWRNHKEEAKANSHENACVPTRDGYKKWCVLCGSPFETVNALRRTCGACQDRIFRNEDRNKARREAKKRAERKLEAFKWRSRKMQKDMG